MCMSVFKGEQGGSIFIKFQVCLQSHGIPRSVLPSAEGTM